MDDKDLRQVESMMTRVVGVFAEDVQHKFKILAEGQQLISEKLELTRSEFRADSQNRDKRLTVFEARLGQQIDGLKKKVDVLSADLTAHRQDTDTVNLYPPITRIGGIRSAAFEICVNQ